MGPPLMLGRRFGIWIAALACRRFRRSNKAPFAAHKVFPLKIFAAHDTTDPSLLSSRLILERKPRHAQLGLFETTNQSTASKPPPKPARPGIKAFPKASHSLLFGQLLFFSKARGPFLKSLQMRGLNPRARADRNLWRYLGLSAHRSIQNLMQKEPALVDGEISMLPRYSFNRPFNSSHQAIKLFINLFSNSYASRPLFFNVSALLLSLP